MLCASVLFLIFFIDYTLHETITVIKLSAISAILSLLIISILQENAIKEFYGYGYPSLKSAGYFSIFVFLLTFIFVVSILYWVIKTLINTPKQLKKKSEKLLYSALIYIIASFFFLIQQMICVPISGFFTIAGMIIMIVAIMNEPKILYILPFKTDRLIVIYKESDVEIFSHRWGPSNMIDDLLAGFMSAINKVGLEVINQGELKYIAYENGVVLIKRTENLIFGLIVNKTSKFLNKCLHEFSIEFQNKYQHILNNWNGDLGVFKDVNTLLEKHFGYIPSRIPQ